MPSPHSFNAVIIDYVYITIQNFLINYYFSYYKIVYINDL